MSAKKTQQLADGDETDDLDATWLRTPSQVLEQTGMPTVFRDPNEELIALSSRRYTQVTLEAEDTPSSREVPKEAGPVAGNPLPPDAPEWMRLARTVSTSLERMIDRGYVDDWDKACVERTLLAWTLVGISKHRMRNVAHLLRRAHKAIRTTRREVIETAYQDCSEVVYGALPADIRRETHFETIYQVVRELREEADPWLAVVHATAKILGWTDYSRAHAAQALRIAIMDVEDT